MRIRLKGLNKITKRLADGTRRTYWYAWKGGPPLRGEPGTPEFLASYNEAVAKRKAELASPPSGLPTAQQKFLAFIKSGIEPACYLYRHFGPDGDLLYVGVSLHALERQKQHIVKAAWMKNIYQIIIEPFATREEALAAEELAIKTEFPKFNSTHNKRRNPFQELARLRERAAPSEHISMYPEDWNEARLEANRHKPAAPQQQTEPAPMITARLDARIRAQPDDKTVNSHTTLL